MILGGHRSPDTSYRGLAFGYFLSRWEESGVRRCLICVCNNLMYIHNSKMAHLIEARWGRRRVLERASTACIEELQRVQDSCVSNVNRPLPLLPSANLFVLGCFHPLFSASVPALGAGGLFSVRRLKLRLQPN